MSRCPKKKPSVVLVTYYMVSPCLRISRAGNFINITMSLQLILHVRINVINLTELLKSNFGDSVLRKERN